VSYLVAACGKMHASKKSRRCWCLSLLFFRIKLVACVFVFLLWGAAAGGFGSVTRLRIYLGFSATRAGQSSYLEVC